MSIGANFCTAQNDLEGNGVPFRDRRLQMLKVSSFQQPLGNSWCSQNTEWQTGLHLQWTGHQSPDFRPPNASHDIIKCNIKNAYQQLNFWELILKNYLLPSALASYFYKLLVSTILHASMHKNSVKNLYVGCTLWTAPGFTLFKTLHRIRPLRSAKQNSSSVGSFARTSDAPWSICLSHAAAWYLLAAVTSCMHKSHYHLSFAFLYFFLFFSPILPPKKKPKKKSSVFSREQICSVTVPLSPYSIALSLILIPAGRECRPRQQWNPIICGGILVYVGPEQVKVIFSLTVWFFSLFDCRHQENVSKI